MLMVSLISSVYAVETANEADPAASTETMEETTNTEPEENLIPPPDETESPVTEESGTEPSELDIIDDSEPPVMLLIDGEVALASISNCQATTWATIWVNTDEYSPIAGKRNHAENYSIKQMERTRKSLENRLAKLNDQSRKDDVVTFEQLGVDRIFVDESHYFKNLFLATKMRNVGGIAQTEAQKSSDLFMKCQYLDEITGGRGVIFATGTPISNSMVELYTIQRYLQYSTLEEMGLLNFDDWAANYGETVTAIELSPEGTGYRSKTRFAKFYNLPELMSAFKMVADIQTADMLMLPVPKANFHTEIIKPSPMQEDMIKSLADRAEEIRAGHVDPSVDNMLKITNDGRKLALDMRLVNPLAPDSDTSKTSICARNVFSIWERTQEQRSAQILFCDLSTPKGDGSFNIYDDLKKKLVAKGIPPEEIAYIHEANTEVRKKELFSKVRSGQVRVLIGSTASRIWFRANRCPANGDHLRRGGLWIL